MEHAAVDLLPDPQLKGARKLAPYLALPNESLPTFIAGEHLTGKTDTEVVVSGNAELRKRNTILQSDRLTFWQETQEVEADGNVRLLRDGDNVRGPKMRMKTESATGFFEKPDYVIRRNKTAAPSLWTVTDAAIDTIDPKLTTGRGSAAWLDFEGEGKYHLTDATYSTCSPAPGNSPDWFARTTDLRLNYDEEVGTAKNATLYFKGLPILYAPWMTFSLNNERKSGLLAPTFGSTSKGGAEYSQPYYWNIAPNKDATITPRVMSKRGTLWNGEFRYLEHGYGGIIQAQGIANDSVINKSRGSYSIAHAQDFGRGVTGSLNLNGASDGTYFSDLGTGSAVIAQTNLLRQATLGYSGGWWSANMMAQSYQTLQDPSLPNVAEPYRRLPQVTLVANRRDLPLGLNVAFSGEYVDFRHPGQVEAERTTLYPQISLPMTTEAITVTPKLSLHSTRYTLNHQAAGVPKEINRTVPIYSVDAGMTFERTTSIGKADFIQTLEPRLFYLYVPTRNQSQIPVFDTAATGFGFAQIFAENSYSGGDRIANADQITAMMTSRFLDAETGAQLLSAGVGQRVYFTTQDVGLPGEVLRTNRESNVLGAISGFILPKTTIDAGAEYSPRFSRVEVLNVGGRFQPEAGKVINAGYRYTRDQLAQVDVSGQWPVFNGWHAVGRFNYSTKENRLIESVAGLEYDGSCWIGRVAFQRLATLTQESNTSLFFQLEFNGFAKIGSNPLDMLKRSVPGYGIINQQTDPTPTGRTTTVIP